MFVVMTVAGLVALSALIVRVMIRVGRLDRPGPRSSHVVPTPKGGGVGIAMAFVAGSLVFWADGLAKDGLGLLGLVAAGVLLASIAYLDDLRDWPFSIKLGAQALAAVIVAAVGIRLGVVPVFGVRIGLLAVPAGVVWVVFATNAMNFMDGLNGLAAGVALVGCAAVAAWPGNPGIAVACALALGAGIAGFLPFNFPAARIFMGDVGSQLCGFVLASLALVLTASPLTRGASVLVPAVLFGFLFDVAVTLVRRALAGARLTEAHREHLYQQAQRGGMASWLVAAIHWGMAGWGAVCAYVYGRAPGAAGLIAGLMLLAPQIGWAAYVVSKAARTRNSGWPAAL